MVDLIHGLSAETVRANLERVQRRLAEAGRRPGEVQILAAVKYLPAEELGALAAGGITLVGENRAQALVAKAPAHPELTWDFIGVLQSRKVAQIVPHVRYIHSVASESVLAQLAKHARPDTRVLIEINIAGEAGKDGISPAQLPEFLERCPAPVVGLMTMPPLAADPEHSRRYFAALRELAERHGLRELSMGTSQDYGVAAEEGATIIRLGSLLYHAVGESTP
ncbi:MAG TPA: YggS family pyridoxal phosphate enzyme [Solirubrobacteraceae bacterium]|nr:YggS family pyridoxal phosphate enzyme [Solirubrobacteraceae bacterium]